MEMIALLPKRNLKSDRHVLGLIAISWFAFLLCFEPHSLGEVSKLFFAAIAGSVSFLILKVSGYFDTLRMLPRRSDIFLILLAIPLGGIATNILSNFMLGIEVTTTLTMLMWSPVLALGVFVTHYGMNYCLLKSGKKRKIVLDLLPEERDAIMEDFSSLEMDEYINFLSVTDLKEHLLRANEKEIDVIIISRNAASKFDAEGLLLRAHLAGIPIVDYPAICTGLTGRIRLPNTDLTTYLLNATPQTPLLRAFLQFKIMMEPLIAVLIGLLLSPVMIVLAVLIKLSSNGPVLYRQLRTGYLGKNFTLLKFRSMYVDAEANGPQWATENDCRVTPIGRFMRKTRLDELPQLLNVIRGEMGFFGPRPERPEIYRELKKEIPVFSMRTVVRPGITGWAQVYAGYAASVAESEIKLEYDLFYIQHMSPRLDLIILIKTLIVALYGDKKEKHSILSNKKSTGDLPREVLN